MTPLLVLAAREPLPKDWRNNVQAALEKNADFKVRRHRQGLFVYRDVSSTPGFTFCDGVALERVWLGPRRWAFGGQMRRLYFQSGSDRVDSRPEHEIVGSSRPFKPPAAAQIELINRVLDLSSREDESDYVVVDSVDLIQQGQPHVQIGDEDHRIPPNFNGLYKDHGFDLVPGKWLISVCPVDETPREAAVAFCRKLEAIAIQRRASLKVQIVDELLIRSHLEDSTTPSRPGKTILFLLPRKGNPPSAETIRLFRDLDFRKLTYRRAYSNDPFDISIPDQLPSLLMASGGRPHRTEVQRQGEPVWSVGIDLSHRANETESTLVSTLVDPKGSLVGSWTTRHARNEKPDPAAVGLMMGKVAERIQGHGAENEPVLVIRDGRMFEGETFQLYESAFSGPATVIEYRKRRNPPVIAGSSPAQSPGAFLVRDECTMFIATMPPRNSSDLPSTVKVSWRPNWNQAMFSPSDLADALIGLSLAPGLGMHRREKPAPIYWADGIAGFHRGDLRFAGNAPVRIDL